MIVHKDYPKYLELWVLVAYLELFSYSTSGNLYRALIPIFLTDTDHRARIWRVSVLSTHLLVNP